MGSLSPARPYEQRPKQELICTQILSLQLRPHLEVSQKLSVLLLIASLAEIKVDKWSYSLPLMGLYMAVLGTLLWGGQDQITPQAFQQSTLLDDYEM